MLKQAVQACKKTYSKSDTDYVTQTTRTMCKKQLRVQGFIQSRSKQTTDLGSGLTESLWFPINKLRVQGLGLGALLQVPLFGLTSMEATRHYVQTPGTSP